MKLPPPRSTLFPYTTLFRSASREGCTYGSCTYGFCTFRGFPTRPVTPESAAGAPRGKPHSISVQPWPQCGLGNLGRSEEHTSELQSRENLVCRLLLEKKQKE